MKRHWITFTSEWKPSTLSYWVHREGDGDTWESANRFHPPLPKPVPGKGYASFHVEINNVTFLFASLEELQHCYETLEHKLLPNTLRLIADRGTTFDVHQHWLNLLPPKAKPWRYREMASKYLRESHDDFRKQLGLKD